MDWWERRRQLRELEQANEIIRDINVAVEVLGIHGNVEDFLEVAYKLIAAMKGDIELDGVGLPEQEKKEYDERNAPVLETLQNIHDGIVWSLAEIVKIKRYQGTYLKGESA